MSRLKATFALHVKMPRDILELPSEILVQVMDYVGSAYFRKDLGRLSICKKWFTFAHAALFKQLRLSPKILRRLLSSRDAEKSLHLIKENLTVLQLNLKGFEDWSSIPDLQLHLRDANSLYPTDICGSLGNAILTTWTVQLDDDLVKLTNIAKGCRKLRTVRIEATREHISLFPHLFCRDYLSQSTICSMLSVKNLMILELDLCGTALSKPLQEDHDNLHICESIGALLPTLTRLRLRMRNLCAHVLKPKYYHNARLRLNEVIINLSLSYDSQIATTKVHSGHCRSPGKGFHKLNIEIKKQAKALIPQMASPKVFRILAHTVLHLEPVSFDVLTGKHLQLTEETAWEEDGEVIEDVSDQESSDIPSLPD